MTRRPRVKAWGLDLTPPNVAPSPRNDRQTGRAIWRGLCGRCPRCGEGRLLTGYITPISQCKACGELLAPYRTADFAPYIVTFIIGLIFTPLIVALSMSGYGSNWLTTLFVLMAVAWALALLPRAKGAAIALLWALDIQ